MEFKDIYAIQDETEQVQKTYELFNEDTRLSHGQAARVEFLTTVHYIEKYLKPGASILDVGAGTGAYSFYFSRMGYPVSALELADNNIRVFRQKLTPEDNIDLRQGNALDLSHYGDESFDAVLLFGPLYHLHRVEDRLQCIREAKRVCKPDGMIFFAFISNDMVILTEFSYRPDYFLSGDYDKETFKLEDFPFVFHTVDDCRALLRSGGVEILKEVASDGVSELLAEKINAMDEDNFVQYLRYHFYICEKPELLGMSNHLLFIGRKGTEHESHC
ncbi:MAG: class I SAM-dependent methyltransferase [Ruminococcaceae bacterium]|nr:class I SAM-dependent methyltransferase [Oscillospiraceae bacterium]